MIENKRTLNCEEICLIVIMTDNDRTLICYNKLDNDYD